MTISSYLFALPLRSSAVPPGLISALLYPTCASFPRMFDPDSHFPGTWFLFFYLDLPCGGVLVLLSWCPGFITLAIVVVQLDLMFVFL